MNNHPIFSYNCFCIPLDYPSGLIVDMGTDSGGLIVDMETDSGGLIVDMETESEKYRGKIAIFVIFGSLYCIKIISATYKA